MPGQRIVNYFYTCGLNEQVLQIGDDGNIQACPSISSRLPLMRSFRCKILQYFPSHLPNCPFDVESTNLVTMPNGTWFCTEDQLFSSPHVFPRRHTFIITKEDGSRVHGLALLFPIEVRSESVKQTVALIQDRVLQTRTTSDSYEDNAFSNSSLYRPKHDRLFSIMAIGLLSNYPFIHGLFGWLEDLWAALYINPQQSKESTIESFVRKLLHETRLSKVGCLAEFAGVFRTHFAYIPAINNPIINLFDGLISLPWVPELPVFEYSFVELLRSFHLDEFLRLFTCVLMEHRIILFSSSHYRLMLTAEGITCLLLPFTWSHVYAPILPRSLVHFVDAPVPYIMGVKQCEHLNRVNADSSLIECHMGCITSIEVASEANVCYVYVDEGRVLTTDDVPQFPNADQVKEAVNKLMLATHSIFAVNNVDHSHAIDRLRKIPTAPVLRPRPPAPPLRKRPELPSVATEPHLNLQQQSNNTVSPPPVCEGDVSVATDPVTTKCGNYLNICTESARSIVKQDKFSDYIRLLHFNTAVRSIFLHNFAQLFHNYDKFLVPDDPQAGLNDSFTSGIQAFDKFAFLSDQSETHLPFLSAFLETQMFVSFLDLHTSRKVPTHLYTAETTSATNLLLFDHVIAHTRDTLVGLSTSRTMSRRTEPVRPVQSADPSKTTPLPDLLDGATYGMIPLRERSHDLMCQNGFPPLSATVPTSCSKSPSSSASVVLQAKEENLLGQIPALETHFLNQVPHSPLDAGESMIHSCHLQPPSSNQSFTGHILHQTISSAPVSPPITIATSNDSNERNSGSRSTPTRRSPTSPSDIGIPSDLPSSKLIDPGARLIRSFAQSHHLASVQRAGMAQTNWDFVDTLLDECKHRTKRMVLKQIGHEATELGHLDPTVYVVEENTLVSGLCDLLERIWSHGLEKKAGKSALWSHLVHYAHRVSPHPTQLPPSKLSSSSSNSSSCNNSPPVQVKPSVGKSMKEHALKSTESTNQMRYSPRGQSDNESLKHWDTKTSLNSSSPQDVGIKHRPQNTPPTHSDVHRRALSASRPPNSAGNLSGMLYIVQFPDEALQSRSIMHSTPFTRHNTFPSSYSLDADSLMETNSGGTIVLDLSTLLDPIAFNSSSLLRDIMSVQNIRGVKTDIGFARAFVRLALEKKLLSYHLSALMAEVKLLRKLYSRYAFLRCEEEREQFLYHLLSLNAVDYYSFTRMLPQASLTYRIYICSGRKHGFPSTANTWIRLHGHLGRTKKVSVSRGVTVMEVTNTNLGLLSIVQIGHDNAGPTPKWFIEFVLIHCVMTNQLYLFPCGHWLGRGIEDDALERVLIGERIQIPMDSSRLVIPITWRDPTENVPKMANLFQSPGLRRRSVDQGQISPMAIHEQVANAVNQLLMYCSKSVHGGRPNVASLTGLWCGNHGLIPSLRLAFAFGFRAKRLFQRRLFVWDFIERVCAAYAIEFNLYAPTHSTPPSPIVSTAAGSRFPYSFSTHSLPRPPRNRIPQPAGALTPKPMHCSALFTVQPADESGGHVHSTVSTWTHSQPTSPSTVRIFTTTPTHRFQQEEQRSLTTATHLTADSCQQMATLRQSAINLVQHVQQINMSAAHLGKEGKLQCLICRAIRSHLLAGWFAILALSPITSQMYEAKSFFLNTDLRQAIQGLLSALDEFDLPLDPVLCADG